jgi:hypothetical protein
MLLRTYNCHGAVLLLVNGVCCTQVAGIICPVGTHIKFGVEVKSIAKINIVLMVSLLS